MDFDGFDWDEGNTAKCCKHGVSVEEIEFVLLHTNLFSEDPAHSIDEQRSIAVGEGPQGRMTFVALTMRVVSNVLLLRPVSARYMHEKEFRRYAEKDGDRSSGHDH